MRRSLSMWIGILLLGGLLGALAPAWGQEVAATIVGTVTDPSGAPIKGASIVARDTERGAVWKAETNETGDFNILRLPVGTYTVEATAAGFDKSVYPPFTLVLNQTARFNFQMKVGKVSETVEVTGAAPILQTETTEVSTLIDSTSVTSMALVTRNYMSLTLLAPGATTPSPGEYNAPGLMTTAGRPYINGNREQANALLLDGIDISENSNNEVGYTPSPDAIQEFNMITQNASAEFGSYEGGVISTAIKSGTNSFHGSAFEFYRDGNFNANPWANGLTNPVVTKPGLNYNQFGAAVGGPIIKNKLFFFADYEGQRFDQPPSGGNVYLMTSAFQSGNFGALCTSPGGSFNGAGICTGGTQITDPNNGGAPIPFNNFANASAASQTESPVTQALFAALPTPDAQGNVPVTNGQVLNNDQGDLKIDYNMSDRNHVSGRWSQARVRNPFTSSFALSEVSPALQPVRNADVQWLHTFSPSLLNEVRFGFNAVDINNSQPTAGNVGNLAQTIGITDGNAYSAGLPIITAGNLEIGANGLYQTFHTSTPQVDEILSITRGRHQFKVGYQYERLRLDQQYSGNAGELGSITFGGGLTGSPYSDLWMGNASTIARGSTPELLGRRGTINAVFAEDNWRVSNTLTVNLGLRWEDHTPFNEIHNNEVNFAGGGLVAGGLQVMSGQKALYNNYLGIGDFLPRIGVAWSPEAMHNKMVFRASYGISEYVEGGGVGENLTANFPFATSYNAALTGAAATQNFGNVFANATPANCPTPITISCYAGISSIYMFDPNFRPAMAQQWNVTVQQQINNATTFQIGYVGQHGTHLYNFMEYNQVPLLDASGNVITKTGELGTPATSPYYLTGNPALITAPTKVSWARGNASNGSQEYNALQAVLQHRLSKGLDAQVAYTWSKCMSDSGGFYGTWSNTQTSHGQVGWTNIFAPRIDWGPCFWDQTHVLTSYVTYQLPIGRGKMVGNNMSRALDEVVGGWEVGAILSVHSGNAMSNFTGWGDDPVAWMTTGASNLFGGDRSNCSGPVNYSKKLVPATATTSAYVQWFDPSTFSNPAETSGGQIAYGTCGAGGIRGPKYVDVDTSVHKAFAITERMKIEFRAEAYNVFNHASLNAPDVNYGDLGLPNGGFGAITSAQDPRKLQLALKFNF
jgi:hypothetical protein